MTTPKYIIQSVLVPKNKFTLLQATDWIIKHGYKYDKIDVNQRPSFYSYRQVHPNKLIGYKYINKILSNGIELILSYK